MERHLTWNDHVSLSLYSREDDCFHCRDSGLIKNVHQAEEPSSSACLRLLVLVSLLGLVALTNGCAALAALPIGSLVGSPNASALQIYNTTEVRLQERNFVVIKTNVVGQCSGFSLFGILTIVPARFTKAMDRLYAQSEMKSGHPQTLAHLIMEQNSSYFILFSIPKTFVRADIIEFTPKPPQEFRPPPPEPGAPPPPPPPPP